MMPGLLWSLRPTSGLTELAEEDIHKAALCYVWRVMLCPGRSNKQIHVRDL